MTHTIDTINQIKVNELSNPTFKAYRVRYYCFGSWVPKETFSAESDAEAIFDANMIVANAPAKDKLTYALFQGNRKVKIY